MTFCFFFGGAIPLVVLVEEITDKFHNIKGEGRFSISNIKEVPKKYVIFVLQKLCLQILKISHFFSGYLTEFISTLNMYFVFFFVLYMFSEICERQMKEMKSFCKA